MQLEFLQRPVAVLIRVSVFLQRPVAEIEVLEYRTRTIASCTIGCGLRIPCREEIPHEGHIMHMHEMRGGISVIFGIHFCHNNGVRGTGSPGPNDPRRGHLTI